MIILCSSQRIGTHFLIGSFSSILILTPKINHSDPVTNSLSVSILPELPHQWWQLAGRPCKGSSWALDATWRQQGDPSMVASYLIQIMTLDQIPFSFQGTPTATRLCVLLAVILLIMTWQTLDETKQKNQMWSLRSPVWVTLSFFTPVTIPASVPSLDLSLNVMLSVTFSFIHLISSSKT